MKNCKIVRLKKKKNNVETGDLTLGIYRIEKKEE